MKTLVLLLSSMLCSFSFAQTTASKSENILVFGDSLFYGKFGKYFHQGLEKRGATTHVRSLAGCGFGLKSWVTGGETTCGYFIRETGQKDMSGTKRKMPDFVSEIEKNHPQVVIFALGDNMAGYNSISDSSKDLKTLEKRITKQVENAKESLDKINGRCIWVTPTWGNVGKIRKSDDKLNAIVEGLKKSLGDRCEVIDSRELVSKKIVATGDGVHVDPNSARIWGEKASEKVLKILNDCSKVDVQLDISKAVHQSCPY